MNHPVPLIEARALSRVAPGSSQRLLDRISVCLHPGECVALVGPTGSGKTLLLRALALLDATEHGEVLWLGQPVRAQEVPRYRAQVMYLHQRPALVEGTVAANLRMPYLFRVHTTRAWRQDMAVQALTAIGRDASLLERAVQNLSGGESQIVALLRAMLLEPTVLLLDEPTASLDQGTARAVEQLVTDWLSAQPTRAAIWVTHDRRQVEKLAQRTLEVSDGKLVSQS